MVDEKAYHLLRVLKDVDKEEVITKLNQIKKNSDTHISHLFLDEYFRTKDASISRDVYQYEAQCIVNIFPQYSVEYIQSMLETLGSENNRVIIILRQLLKNEPINNFTVPNTQMLLQNRRLPDYPSYRDSIEACSSSNISPPKCDNELRNAFDTKQETLTSLKRKANAFPLPTSPKIKIVPMASISNSTSQNRYKIPETCTGNYNINIPSTSVRVNDYGFKSEVIPELEKLQMKKPVTPKLLHKSLDNFLGKYMLEVEGRHGTAGQQEHQSEPLNLITDAPAKQDLNVSSTNNLLATRGEISPSADVTSSVKTMDHLIPPMDLLKLQYDSHQKINFPVDSSENGGWNLSKPVLKLYKDSQGKWNRETEKSNTAVITEVANPEEPAFQVSSPEAYMPYTKPLPKEAQNRKNKLITLNKIAVPRMLRPDQSLMEISSEEDELSDTMGYSSEDAAESLNPLCYIDFDEPQVADLTETLSEPEVAHDNKLISKIMEMFPDASPAYIKELCVGKTATATDVDDVLQIIFSNPDYPKRIQREPSPDPDLDLEKQVSLFKEVLPDADPNYLQYHAELYLHDKKKLAEFVSNALETRNYPTIKEYLRKQQLSAQVKQYTSEFNIEKFLEIIPDPDSYFNDPIKKSPILINDKVDLFSVHYATGFLKNQYPTISIKTINYVMSKQNDNLINCVKELDKIVASKKGLLKSRRKAVCMDNSTIQNIPLLQEIAYLSHKVEIKSYLEEKKAKEKREMELAKISGLLRTCNCCYNEEVMPKNIVKCINGCDFCNECVRTSAEILFGEGKLDFPCLQSCTGFFSLQTLKDVLSPKMFSKMAQKKQLEEVKAAGIDELETCPFCDFATIPAPGDKLFRCLNPECMKESCRQCKEPSHVPLHCDEIEKDDDVKRRTYIENKMTEALIRICYKCGMKFIKADGCNKMTCSCGAMMCYVCGKPVKDYKHFNGQGGDQYHLCPLYSDTNQLHKEAVIKGAEQAKAEIGIAEDSKKLKIDPAADLHQHYKTRKTKTEENRDMLVDGIAAARVRLNDMNQLFMTLEQRANRRARYRNHHYPHHRH